MNSPKSLSYIIIRLVGIVVGIWFLWAIASTHIQAHHHAAGREGAISIQQIIFWTNSLPMGALALFFFLPYRKFRRGFAWAIAVVMAGVGGYLFFRLFSPYLLASRSPIGIMSTGTILSMAVFLVVLLSQLFGVVAYSQAAPKGAFSGQVVGLGSR